MIDLEKLRPPSQLPKENLLDLAKLASFTPQGNFLELGVYKGGSAWVLNEIAVQQKRELFLFDTFAGLPFERQGQMTGFADTSLTQVREWFPRAKIFQGIFPKTLTDEAKDLAFVHVDCDLRNGCSAALKYLWPRMVIGGIMAFDDWGFDDIQKPVIAKFGRERVQFSSAKIPYVIKKEGDI